MTTRLAFYRGLKRQNSAARIGDRLICLVTGKPFSHCELVVSLVTLGSEVYSTMLSSSLRDGDSKPAIQYIRSRIGTPYGWFDLLSFLLPFRVSWSGSDFCSEVVSAAPGLDKPWHKSPGDLYDWAMLQPGARIVPDDELLIPWSAS